ncbi:hypothetical protein AXF42_Ash011910 [Apostasia shenzhenica]|uniref:Nucleic acid-binding protein n=1 Tax=Apostasia shenzhenica TaxID=1088818 RepID=A0A2I0AW90_9ASPA|nr:hypothetical protein AXF42_Ash011910 [Apostasia shenzhenica]
MGPLTTIRTTTGLSSLLEISLIDNTYYNEPMTLTIWNGTFNKYHDILTTEFEEDTILMASGLRIKIFRGKHILETTTFTELSFSTSAIEEANKLLLWYKLRAIIEDNTDRINVFYLTNTLKLFYTNL